MKTWFRFQNAAPDATAVDIHIIDFIGGWIDDEMNRFWGEQVGVTARAFVEQLAALPDSVKTLNVHINSPGGDVQGGVNIANALREQQAKGRTVVTHIDGLAASIASVIAMAGSQVYMADNALMMIHNPYGMALGDAAEMRKTAEVLDAMRGQIVASYQWHSSLSSDEIIALMDAETWMSADEAIAAGFATDKVEGLKAAASIDRRAASLLRIPEQYRNRVESFLQPEPTKPDPPPAKPQAAAATEILSLCAAAELGIEFASALIAEGATLAQAEARVNQAKADRQAAAQRATEIRSICAMAHLEDLADAYVAGGMPVDQVRAQLVRIKARLDAIEVDGSLPPDQGGKPKPRIDVSAVYAELNRLTK